MSNINKKLDDLGLGFQMFSPTSELKPYIQCYWSIYIEDELSQPVTYKIVSDGGMGVVLNFGHNFSIRIGDNIHTTTSKCMVAGPTEKATFLRLSKKIDAIGIHFQPGGAYPFFQQEISNFTDKIIPMLTNNMWRAMELYSSLKMTKIINDKISVIDEFLLKKLHESSAVPSLWVSQVVGIVREHNGSMKIDELAKKFNISRRHFERRFKKEVGLSPKQFSTIVRIEKSRSLIRSLNFNSLTEVGYECDYYDQAHFVREFKTFVKETPKQYFRRKK
jgi:AraC-like DNA-binding protein